MEKCREIYKKIEGKSKKWVKFKGKKYGREKITKVTIDVWGPLSGKKLKWNIYKRIERRKY